VSSVSILFDIKLKLKRKEWLYKNWRSVENGVNESHGYPFQRREDEAKPEAADQADANEDELKSKKKNTLNKST
jgi:hypothetical protein